MIQIGEIINKTLQNFIWLSIGTTFGFALGILFTSVGITKFLGSLPFWINALFIIFLSAGIFAFITIIATKQN